MKEQGLRPGALLPLLAGLGRRLRHLQVTRTSAALEDILSVCPDLLKLLHFPTNSTSNLAKLHNKLKHITHLETTADLDLPGFQKLFALAPRLERLSVGRRDSSSSQPRDVTIRPGHFVSMLRARSVVTHILKLGQSLTSDVRSVQHHY